MKTINIRKTGEESIYRDAKPVACGVNNYYLTSAGVMETSNEMIYLAVWEVTSGNIVYEVDEVIKSDLRRL
jgi:hypothetical protein